MLNSLSSNHLKLFTFSLSLFFFFFFHSLCSFFICARCQFSISNVITNDRNENKRIVKFCICIQTLWSARGWSSKWEYISRIHTMCDSREKEWELARAIRETQRRFICSNFQYLLVYIRIWFIWFIYRLWVTNVFWTICTTQHHSTFLAWISSYSCYECEIESQLSRSKYCCQISAYLLPLRSIHSSIIISPQLHIACGIAIATFLSI